MSFVFFFKQKTAYEMRISDWSSDVCSSDLDRAIAARHKRRQRGLHAEKHAGLVDRNDPVPPFDRLVLDAGVMDDTGSVRERGERTEGGEGGGDGRLPAFAVRNVEPDEFRLAADRKSTPELQSLMRISSAVFCLKKKKKDKHTTTHQLA